MSPRPNVEEVRREEILRAACAVIAERGYAAARVADIAERSGTSAATVHYYFKTKHNVLTEALAFAGRRASAEHREILASIGSFRDRLVQLVDWQVPDGGSRDDWTIWVEVWNEAMRREEVRSAQHEAYGSWLRTLQEVIKSGIAAGEFRPVDARDFAATLAALVDGLALQVLAGRSLTPRRMRKLISNILERDLYAAAEPVAAKAGRRS